MATIKEAPKQAPQFTKPANMTQTKPSQELVDVQPITRTKASISVRESLFELVKENLHNPKKLQEISQTYSHIKVDFA
jgi:hypothetical protein